MAETERRLVCDFAADIEGFGRLMRNDEVGTPRDTAERRRIPKAIPVAGQSQTATPAPMRHGAALHSDCMRRCEFITLVAGASVIGDYKSNPSDKPS